MERRFTGPALASDRLDLLVNDPRTHLVVVATGLLATIGGSTLEIFWLVLLLIAAVTACRNTGGSTDGGPGDAGGGGGGGGGLDRRTGPHPTTPAGTKP